MPKLTTGIAATPEQREALLEWVRAEGLDPAEIADDGTFQVYSGHVSGHKFFLTGEGQRLWNRKRTGPLKVFFRQPQKYPLPEVLLNKFVAPHTQSHGHVVRDWNGGNPPYLIG